MTRRENDERELIRSARLSPIATIVTDPNADDNPIIAANVPFERLTGYTEQELLGQNCRILVGPQTSPAHSAVLRRAVATASSVVVELINYRKDGSTFLNAVMVAPVFDEDGRLAYFVGSQMEVCERQAGSSNPSAAERIARLTPRHPSVLRGPLGAF